jgi:hypothetical protein
MLAFDDTVYGLPPVGEKSKVIYRNTRRVQGISVTTVVVMFMCELPRVGDGVITKRHSTTSKDQINIAH